MAEKVTSVRLKVVGGQQAKAEIVDLGKSGQQALNRIRDASTPASKGLQALDGVASDVRGRVEALASGIGPVGSGLARLGPAGVAAAAGVAAMTGAIAGGLREFADWELSQRRLEAVLKATGYAAGLTGTEIDAYADDIEKATLATAEGVKQAASVLATFKSVSGDTFTRALGLAQDMAAVFGGDAASAATQLGKALEDPVEGLTALRRAGVTFSAEQKRVIGDLVETGRTAEAQTKILDALAGQVGGAGAAEGNTLTGAFKHAGDSIGDLLQKFVEVNNISGKVRASLDGIAAGARAITAAITADPQAERASISTRLETLRAQLDAAPTGSRSAGRFGGQKIDRRAEIENEIRLLERRQQVIDDTAATEEKRQAVASMGAARQARIGQDEKLIELNAELEKQLKGVATEEEKVAAIRRESAKTITAIEGQRRADGSNGADIDKAKAAARLLEERKVAEALKKTTTAATREGAKVEDIIGDLTAAAENVEDKRAAFIRSWTERLGDKASSSDIAEITSKAATAYDSKLAAAINAVVEPSRSYASTLADLNRLLEEGRISTTAYADAVARADEELSRGNDDVLSRRRDALAGLQSSLGSYARDATNMARNVAQATEGILSSTEDALVGLFSKGKLDIKSLVDSILNDLARLAVRQSITGPLSNFLTTGLANMFAGGGATGAPMNLLTNVTQHHSGGFVGGGGTNAGSYPASLWDAAPRFHEGGTIRPGERPIIAKVGEQIRTAEQQARDAAARAPQVNINVQNEAPGTQAQVERGPSGRPDDYIIKVVSTATARGQLGPSMRSAYGLNRTTVLR